MSSLITQEGDVKTSLTMFATTKTRVFTFCSWWVVIYKPRVMVSLPHIETGSVFRLVPGWAPGPQEGSQFPAQWEVKNQTEPGLFLARYHWTARGKIGLKKKKIIMFSNQHFRYVVLWTWKSTWNKSTCWATLLTPGPAKLKFWQ